MKILIVVEANNNQQTILDCLNNIVWAKDPDINICIIDNFSTDNTQKIVKEKTTNTNIVSPEIFEGTYRGTPIVYAKTSIGRNWPLQNIEVDAYGFIKANMAFVKTFSQRIKEAFSYDKSIGLVYYDSFSGNVPHLYASYDKAILQQKNIIPNSCFLLKEAINKTGYFGPPFHDYWKKLTDFYLAHHIPEILSYEITV